MSAIRFLSFLLTPLYILSHNFAESYTTFYYPSVLQIFPFSFYISTGLRFDYAGKFLSLFHLAYSLTIPTHASLSPIQVSFAVHNQTLHEISPYLLNPFSIHVSNASGMNLLLWISAPGPFPIDVLFFSFLLFSRRY